MDTITSTTNPLIKQVKRLRTSRGRKDQSRSVAEGPRLFAELTESAIPIERILMLEDDVVTEGVVRGRGLNAITVSNEVLRSVAHTQHPQSPFVVFAIPQYSGLRFHPTLFLIDVADPGNVGTSIRSAAAFGWDVAISGETADPWNPKTIRSTAGSVFTCHLSRVEDPIADTSSLGLTTVATVVSGAGTVQEGMGPIALLVGSEAHGLSAELIVAADKQFVIPMMTGVESLNAGVAAGIAMYALGHQPETH